MDINVGAMTARVRNHVASHRIFYSIFLPFALISLLAAIALYLMLLELRLAPLRAEQLARTDAAKSAILRELGQIERVPELIARSPAVRESLDAGQAPATDALAQEFSYFTQISPLIAQVRWIDDTGKERVRVNAVRGTTRIVPEDLLQSKQHRDYFGQTLALGSGETYLSEVDLNLEDGAVVWPLEPTVRAAVSTGRDDGLHDGILIVNFQLSTLFTSLRQLTDDTHQLEIVNDSGFWLLHPDTAMEWGFLESVENQGLAAIDPKLWQQVSGAEFENGRIADGHMRSFSKVRFSSNQASAGADRPADMIILVQTRSDIVGWIRLTSALFAAACAFLLIGGAGLLGWHLSAAYNREIDLKQRLQRESEGLKRAYRSLLSAHERTVLLQNELVESRKLSSLGMVVAGVAQELHTPASSAILNIDEARTTENDIEFRLRSKPIWSSVEMEFSLCRERLELARADLQQVGGLINSFKRLAVDRTLQAAELFQLRGRIEDVLTTMDTRLAQQEIRAMVDIPEDIAMESYPGILSLVIQYLLDNALAHGFEGLRSGTIKIRARIDAGRHIVIVLSDDGRGIDAHIIDNVFDPFVTSARSSGHIGLGMHFVHQWVHQLLQGVIVVESQPGQGTRLTITLPVTLSQANHDAARPSSTTP